MLSYIGYIRKLNLMSIFASESAENCNILKGHGSSLSTNALVSTTFSTQGLEESYRNVNITWAKSPSSVNLPSGWVP